MRKTKAFCPTGLDGLESRIALSTVAGAPVVTAEVAELVKAADHHDHTPKAGDHADHTAHVDRHGEHATHATK
jgi:hypothetical protein